MKSLDGKIVMITGASGGIGAAMAKEAALRGATSVLVGRDAAGLKAVEQSIHSNHGKALSIVTDVKDAARCDRLRDEVTMAQGCPDILVNNAGVGRWDYLETTSAAEIEEMISAPLRAALFTTRAFLPSFLQRGTGAVVNMSSIAAFLPWNGATAYTTTRWAMRGFHEALRADFQGTKLTATLIASGAVATDCFTRNLTDPPRLPWFLPMLKPEALAARTLDGAIRGKPVVILPQGFLILTGMAGLLPDFVAKAMRDSAGKPRV